LKEKKIEKAKKEAANAANLLLCQTAKALRLLLSGDLFVRQDRSRNMQLQPIGIIHSPHTTKDACPIQPIYSEGAEGRVEVFKEYTAGLKDIETFSHIYLLYLFDQAGEIKLVRPTFLDDEPHGVFASRHPCRPNGIGISIVRLERREGDTLIVTGVDVLDGSPLLDIKPYIPRFDIVDSASDGWVGKQQWRPKPCGRE